MHYTPREARGLQVHYTPSEARGLQVCATQRGGARAGVSSTCSTPQLPGASTNRNNLSAAPLPTRFETDCRLKPVRAGPNILFSYSQEFSFK